MSALLLVIIIHEFSHALTAKILGLRCEKIELYPFGGRAEIQGIEDNPAYEGLIAFIGPVASLLTGFLVLKIPVKNPFLQSFSSYSLFVAMFNLIPAYPLDGGRILRCILCLFSEKGKIISSIISVIIAILVCIVGIFQIKNNMESYIVMGVFLLTASLQSFKTKPNLYLRQRYLRNAHNVKWLRVKEGESALSAAKKLFGESYYMLVVTNENDEAEAIISEKTLMDMLEENNAAVITKNVLQK